MTVGYRYQSPHQDKVSPPGSRNAWWMGKCPAHGATSFQTPFGCEACQRARLVEKGLVAP
jgi:hypothetical protein